MVSLSREGASQRGLARAGKACDENEVRLAHLDEFASLRTSRHAVWTCSTGFVPREADLEEPDAVPRNAELIESRFVTFGAHVRYGGLAAKRALFRRRAGVR